MSLLGSVEVDEVDAPLIKDSEVFTWLVTTLRDVRCLFHVLSEAH